MKFKDPITGEYKTLYLKTSDTLPVGTIVSFDGDEIPEGYEEVIGEEARVVISPTEPTTGEEVWLQKGKNLFDKDSVQKGYVYGSNGVLTANTLWNASKFIKVNPNTPYTVQSTQISGKTEKQITLSYWDINRTWIGEKYTTNLVETITTPNNCAYITVSHRNDAQENIQLEQGSTATTYEPYIEKKIYTKNDNGGYEEFYSEESVFKIKTGTGSPIPEYISSAENNHYEKVGKVVSYSFTMAVTGSWGTTTKFITGLPRPKTNVRFLAIDTTNSDKILRCSLNTNGEISNAYSASAPTKGHIIEGYITYITTD